MRRFFGVEAVIAEQPRLECLHPHIVFRCAGKALRVAVGDTAVQDLILDIRAVHQLAELDAYPSRLTAFKIQALRLVLKRLRIGNVITNCSCETDDKKYIVNYQAEEDTKVMTYDIKEIETDNKIGTRYLLRDIHFFLKVLNFELSGT